MERREGNVNPALLACCITSPDTPVGKKGRSSGGLSGTDYIAPMAVGWLGGLQDAWPTLGIGTDSISNWTQEGRTENEPLR